MLLFCVFLCAVVLIESTEAQVVKKLSDLGSVGVDEHLDQELPLNLVLKDSSGRKVRLGDLFEADRPVILSLNYSDCPMLCQLQLNGLVDGLQGVRWDAGEQFLVVSVSIDPLETTQRARQTKQHYFKAYGRPGTADGWKFLTGDADSIRRLADSVGFRFRYVPERKEYAHAAVVMVCTPGGRVSRYLYGVLYPPQTLKMALVEAGEGKIGSTLDRVLLFCFHYDAASGRYAPVAQRLMKAGAAITLLFLVVGLLPAYLRRRASEQPVKVKRQSLPKVKVSDEQ